MFRSKAKVATLQVPDGDRKYLYDKDVDDIYENGKNRRYSMLFAANGAAYTIATFLVGSEATFDQGSIRLKSLLILAIFMAFFSLIMCYDISEFGQRMHKLDAWVRNYDQMKVKYADFPKPVYQFPGKFVLVLFCAMLVLTWFAVGFAAYSPDTFGLKLPVAKAEQAESRPSDK